MPARQRSHSSDRQARGHTQAHFRAMRAGPVQPVKRVTDKTAPTPHSGDNGPSSTAPDVAMI